MAEGIFGTVLGGGYGGGKSLQQAINLHQQWWQFYQQQGLAAGLLGADFAKIEAKVVYKTQKARGLEAGWALSSNSGYGYKVAPHHGVMPYVPPDMLSNLVFPKFARPCPVTPRHGFVESRDVKDIHELEALFKETREHDPDGEMIIMDRLSGRYSAVMTATSVGWGLSNDGITGGKGESRVIPCPAGRFDATLLPYLGISAKDETQGVYAELVEDKGAVCVVQMRLGPRQPDSRVKRVMVALTTKINYIVSPEDDDLIKWDNLLKKDEYRCRAAQVLVWLPGQTMASHFAVQGIANGYNVSVEETCPVEEGDFLKPDTSGLAPLEAADYIRLGELLTAEKTTRFWDYPRDVLLGIGTLHALPFWDNAPHLLALRARGVMIAARYGLAACLGESRHHLHMNSKPAKVPWKKLMDTDSFDSRPSRSYVFVRSFAMPWEMGPELALAAAEDMRIGDQPPVMEYLAKGGKLGDYGASFMGHKWEWAALRCHDLHIAVDRFCKDTTQANWNAVLGHYNEIINAAHNGGYLLNKWCSPNLIDNAATMPSIVFGFRNVMNLVWGDRKDEPRVAWLALSAKGTEAGKYVETDDGVLVPSLVWKQMEDDGVVASHEQCKCAICMKPKWEAIGIAAMSQGTPCYVPDAMYSKMPKLSVGGDNYSLTIEQLTEPVKKEEPVGDDPECMECGCSLSDGECTNSECKNCPDYEPPTCWECETPLEGDDCPNKNCKCCLEYEEPEEEPVPTEAEAEKPTEEKPDADGVSEK